MKVWITKYVLTQGIFTREVTQSRGAPSMVTYEGNGNFGSREHYHGEGKDWHRTAEGALARAEQMRTKKLSALEKKLAQLGAMQFQLPE